MLATAERVKSYGPEPDTIIWHRPAPGHRCNGGCDWHPIACSDSEGIVLPGPKREVPLNLNRPGERWCAACLSLRKEAAR